MARFPKVPKETEERIIHEMKKGEMPQKDIAAMFGIHQTTISNVMGRYRRKLQHGDLKVKRNYGPKLNKVAPADMKIGWLKQNKKFWPRANMAHVIRVEELPNWDILVSEARKAKLYSKTTVGRDIANGLRRIIARL